MRFHENLASELLNELIEDALHGGEPSNDLDFLSCNSENSAIPLFDELTISELPESSQQASFKESDVADASLKILESTMYNLMQEVLVGELRLDRPPRFRKK